MKGMISSEFSRRTQGKSSRRAAAIRVRELYSIGKGARFVCCREPVGKSCLADKQWLLVPSPMCLRTMVPVLALGWLQGRQDAAVVFLETALRLVLEGASRRERLSFQALVLDQGDNFLLMLDGYTAELARPQDLRNGESQGAHALASCVRACAWLLAHCSASRVEVLLAGPSDPMRLLCVEQGLSFTTVRECFSGLGDGVEPCWEAVLESSTALASATRDGSDDHGGSSGNSCSSSSRKRAFFSPHLTLSDLRGGVRSGILLAGRVWSYNHRSGQAFVDVELPRGGTSTVLVPGCRAVNRAFVGDRVVVRLLPRGMWQAGAGSSSTSAMTAAKVVDGASEDVGVARDDDGSDMWSDLLYTEMGSTMLGEDRTGNGGGESMPTAEVVGILQRCPEASEGIIAHIRLADDMASTVAPGVAAARRHATLLAWPLDPQLPPLRVSSSSPEALCGQRVSVRLVDWRFDSSLPEGSLVSVLSARPDGLGRLGIHASPRTLLEEVEEEIRCILEKYLYRPRPFSLAAKAGLPIPAPGHAMWEPTDPGATHGRMDLRADYTVFSVDPNGCTDIDDAMSVRILRPPSVTDTFTGSGNDGSGSNSCTVELGVHIADVTAFVREGSALDTEGARRATTVYMPHRRVDMLPAAISSDAASLHGGCDRWAVSTLWTLSLRRVDGKPLPTDDTGLQGLLVGAVDGTGPPVVFGDPYSSDATNIKMGRSLIRNAAAMTYDQAARLIDGNAPNTDLPPSALSDALVAGHAVPNTLWAGLRTALLCLTLLARQLTATRRGRGAWDLGGAGLEEARYSFAGPAPTDLAGKAGTDEATATDAVPKSQPKPQPQTLTSKVGSHLEIHDTVAEVMIVTNSAVAKLLVHRLGPRALVRCHPAPSLAKLLEARHLAQQLGLPIFAAEVVDEVDRVGAAPAPGGAPENQCEGELAAPSAEALGAAAQTQRLALQQELRQFRDKLAALAVDPATLSMCANLALTTMNEAKYATVGQLLAKTDAAEHAGLGLQYYTHFTSPIRRYADVVVHRQLLAVLDEDLDVDVGSAGGGVAAESAVTAGQEDDDLLANLLAGVHDGVNAETEIIMNMDMDVDSVGGGYATAVTSGAGAGADMAIKDEMSDLLADLLGDCDVEPPPPPPPDNETEARAGVAGTVSRKSKAVEDSAWLQETASHLNSMTRRAKLVQRECQRLFLALSLRVAPADGRGGGQTGTHWVTRPAVVQALRPDGFVAFVPGWDCKVFVPLCDRSGEVCLPPRAVAFRGSAEGGHIGSASPDQPGQSGGGPLRRVYPGLRCVLAQTGQGGRGVAGGCGVARPEERQGGHLELRVEESVAPEDTLQKQEEKQAQVQTPILALKVLQSVTVYAWAEEARPGLPPVIHLALAESRAPQVNELLGEVGSVVAQVQHPPSAGADRCNHVTIVIPKPVRTSKDTLYACIARVNRRGPPACATPAPAPVPVSVPAPVSGPRECVRFSRPGTTGRIFFGAMAEDAKEAATAALATVPLQQGHKAAQLRMQVWGEDWAAEEELPSASAGAQNDHDTAGSRSIAGGGAHRMASKDLHQVMTRMNKLKAAKCNTKKSGLS